MAGENLDVDAKLLLSLIEFKEINFNSYILILTIFLSVKYLIENVVTLSFATLFIVYQI